MGFEQVARHDRRTGAERGVGNHAAASHRFEPTQVEASPPLGIDLTRGGIKTIIWATGFRPDCSWLDVPVVDRKGYIRHDGGVVEAPGMYLLGMPFLRRRKSSRFDGVGDDARDLGAHLVSYLSHPTFLSRRLIEASRDYACNQR